MTQQLDIPSATPNVKPNLKPTRKPKKVSPPAQKATKPAAHRKRLPGWASFLIAANGLGLLAVSLAVSNPELANRVLHHPRVAPVIAKVFPAGLSMPTQQPIVAPSPLEAAIPEVAPDRTSLTYEQWLDVLKQEAAAVAKKQPDRLTVLLGDSLSLWFPVDQLPSDRTWLNQGISGDTTDAILKRLAFLDETKPQTLFVMAGINDFKKGSTIDQVYANTRNLLQTLKQKHPNAEIVVQSILPHGETVTVDDRDQILAIPNDQIVQFNQKLAGLAKEEQVLFLNLQPLFINKEGYLRSDLTTDGLHLNPSGYMVWSTALQTFSQTQLRSPETPKVQAEATTPESATAVPEVNSETKPEAQ
jgi:lysophospholipase L1-like esterase